MPPRPATNAPGIKRPIDALEQMQRAVAKSKRKTTVQLPATFARGAMSEDSTLARLLRGGQGGEVRLKLLLSLVMLATRFPYKLPPYTAATFAQMLNLNEPETSGARRVNEALRWLERENLIVRTGRAGH